MAVVALFLTFPRVILVVSLSLSGDLKRSARSGRRGGFASAPPEVFNAGRVGRGA